MPRAYPAAEFKEVYGWRWEHETYHDRLKNIFEVERFSGTQYPGDRARLLWGGLFGDAGEYLEQARASAVEGAGPSPRCTNPLKVNRAVSYVAVLDHVVELLCDPRSTAGETLAAIEHLLQM